MDNGADPNRRDNWTEPILTWALKTERCKGLLATVQLLLMHGANPNLVCYGNRAPQGSFLDQAQKRWVEAKKSSPEDAVEWEQVVDALRTAGAETLEEQLRQGNYQGLPPEQVELVQGILGCSSEAAGLALVVCKGRLDIFEASAHYLPSPEARQPI